MTTPPKDIALGPLRLRPRPPQFAQVRDQPRRRAVERARARGLVGDDRREAQRELLAELHPPLVERVDVPDRALGEHLVLVESDEAPKRARVEAFVEEGAGRAAAGKALVRREP